MNPQSWRLFFDLDGTLSDPSEGMTLSFQYALKSLGRTCPSRAELTRYIGPPLRWTMQQLLSSDDLELIEQAVEYYRQRYGDVGLFENIAYDGIESVLNELQTDGFKLHVVTSKPRVFAERIIGRFGLDRYFVSVFGPDFGGPFDDKSNLLAHVLTVLPVRPRQSIMIGDRASDILAGKNNGTRTIAVAYGFATADELQSVAPDRICHCPAEIRQAVMSLCRE
jgi:phosphoglycolate phosphatase